MADEEYDPYMHRAELLKAPTNNLETLYHLFKGCLGTGVLALPEAFKIAGMINGIVSTFFIGIFSTYLFHVLLRGQYVLCKKRQVGLLRYGESMKVACEVGPACFRPLGNFASGLTDFTLIFYQTGICCIYIMFVTTSLKQIIEVYTEKNMPLYIYSLIIFIPFFLILLVKNLKLLAPFSLIANIATFLTFASVYYYIFLGLDAKFTDRPAMGKLEDYPLIFGTVLFSLQSVPIVILVENNMATPGAMRKPLGPLNVTFLSLIMIYIFTAMLGYWRYGEEIESTITMNFPITEKFAQAIVGSYCFALFVSYGLNSYVPITIICEQYIFVKLDENEGNEGKKMLYGYGVRILYAVTTFLLATCIPLLGLFISLVGCVFLSCLGIIFPAFLEIAAYWEDKVTTPGTIWFWKNILLVLIGIFTLITGGFSSLKGIVDTLMSGEY